MATKLLSRQELYDLVWDMPMRRLAASFGMSDVALAKHCKKAGIPLSQRALSGRIDKLEGALGSGYSTATGAARISPTLSAYTGSHHR